MVLMEELVSPRFRPRLGGVRLSVMCGVKLGSVAGSAGGGGRLRGRSGGEARLEEMARVRSGQAWESGIC